jgi:hypothetical protein
VGQFLPTADVLRALGERSLFRVWLSYTFNNLQVTDGCVSPSKYVQVILIMGCIVGCGMCHSAAGFCVKDPMRGPEMSHVSSMSHSSPKT